MPGHTQVDRGLSIETPLGEDAILLVGFEGEEAVSKLFSFSLALLTQADSQIPFDQLLGQSVKVRLSIAGEDRTFCGIIKALTQGARQRISDNSDIIFVSYSAELVPRLWLLTKIVRHRIFQTLTTPDILRQVFAAFQVEYELTATYTPRNYCVQYGESDFHFATRLMEEEGIRFFFTHADSGPEVVVTDALRSPLCTSETIPYDEATGGLREDCRISNWKKTQELTSAFCILRDHTFQLTGRTLEAKETTIDSINVGKATHRLLLEATNNLEVYNYPGGYARRFDSVDYGGGADPQKLSNIFDESLKTVRLRMQQEESVAFCIEGVSNSPHLLAGHCFNLENHFDADDAYLLTWVHHQARAAGYGSSDAPQFHYENSFRCIPSRIQYRPPSMTPRPPIHGVQTATVVGPSGQEVFCDLYGRVKVQFHWDREGHSDARSSCWIRVSQAWAGQKWGTFFWPRIGNEVVVAFEDGDPDRPLIVGSVYNSDNMPPFELPALNHLAGFKSASIQGKAYKNFNGIVFDDRNGHEHLAFHSERHMSFNSEFDKVFHAGRHKGERVAGANVFTVGNIPGSGGSGGGSNPHWPKPYPQGVLGLNAAMVYGENIQSVVGTNHQLAVGNNFQICVNPVGLIACSADVPEQPFFAEVLSSGIGGNIQMTIGTNAQLVYGLNIEVDAGLPKIELHRDGPEGNALSYGIVSVIGSIAVLYTLAYAIWEQDWQRGVTTIAFQACMDVLLAKLMSVELTTKQADKEREEARQALMDHAKHIDWTMQDAGEFMGSPMRYSPSATNFFDALVAVITVAVMPLVVVAAHEKDPENAS